MNGVSSLAFALAAIIGVRATNLVAEVSHQQQLSLHRPTSQPSASDSMRNGTLPFLDLSPLYGWNEEETGKIRLKDGRGMLRFDRFCEDRLDAFPKSVEVLLVLWNRYHNVCLSIHF